MKNIILTVALLSLAAAACAAGVKAAPGKKPAPQFKAYAMDNNYFTCSIPADWSLQRDKDKDEEYKIYEIELMSPKAGGKAPTAVFVSYYSKASTDFDGYQDYIERNSKNALGETKSARENYEPVKKTTLAGRKGFELSSETMEYLNPESKSDESVQLKEKMYVLPAKEGFYVLKFSAPKADFLANLAVFEKVAKSFKGKP